MLQRFERVRTRSAKITSNFLNGGLDHEFGSVILLKFGPNSAFGSRQFRFEQRFNLNLDISTP